MQCPKYSFEITDALRQSYCKNCDGCADSPRNSSTLPPVDIFKLARGLTDREKSKIEKAKSTGNTINEPEKDSTEVKLEKCPYCGEKAWWLNPYTSKHKCMNKTWCPTHHLGKYLTDYYYKTGLTTRLELSDPMLLSVKMLLADVIYIINRKYEEGHVCADFAQEVVDAAKERGIRCGYVVISFHNSNIAHAIIAFQTDYGLKFFEPQSGNEEEVMVGRCYSMQLEGVPKDNLISEVKITWNDSN